MTAITKSKSNADVYQLRRRQETITALMVTSVAIIILLIYLMPMGYALVTSLKSKAQTSEVNAPILPSTPRQFEYDGETYDIMLVPQEDGTIAEWGLVQARRRGASDFIDPENPEAGIIQWEGNWRTLEKAWEPNVQWDNYPDAWNFIRFGRLLMNTLGYALVTMVGMVSASALTAYGFARFRFPGKNILFLMVLSTMILPPQVTDLPKYAFFVNVLDWGGTWWPLIVPAFFGHAYHVFLLRQFFLTIPREMEEAASIDGAGPMTTFIRVILPQAVPALTASALFHFFYAWNDYFGPLIYLAGNRDAQPISIGLAEFNGLYSSEPQLILAAAIITMILPLAIFFMAQRIFVQGIVITGVDK
ncbi:MAG: ABC transporter permease [Anaerolineaceae bacterium]|nr:ABC transporter permease [Anaerolineaceae bacterium]